MFSILFKPEKWKEITPIWFDWLGWFLALGAVGYIAEKTHSIGLQIVYGISYIAFFMFITTRISDILKLKFVRNQKLNNVISLFIAIAVLAVTQFILQHSIKDLLKD